MTAETESIFDLDDSLNFSYDRNKEDYLKVSLIDGTTNLNRPGAIRFELNNQQHYINLSDSFISCEFTITKSDGTTLGNDDIALENNFFPKCFTQMILTIGG